MILMPESAELVPHTVYLPRKRRGECLDNGLFAQAVEKTGKKTLIIAGCLDERMRHVYSVDAEAAGFNVYAVVDASGDPTKSRPARS